MNRWRLSLPLTSLMTTPVKRCWEAEVLTGCPPFHLKLPGFVVGEWLGRILVAREDAQGKGGPECHLKFRMQSFPAQLPIPLSPPTRHRAAHGPHPKAVSPVPNSPGVPHQPWLLSLLPKICVCEPTRLLPLHSVAELSGQTNCQCGKSAHCLSVEETGV